MAASPVDDISIYGQESNYTAWRLANASKVKEDGLLPMDDHLRANRIDDDR